METAASSGTGNFPVDNGEIWTPMYSGTLNMGSSSIHPPTQMEVEFNSAYDDDATTEIQRLLEGPQDERSLDECLEGCSDQPQNMQQQTLQCICDCLENSEWATTEAPANITCVLATHSDGKNSVHQGPLSPSTYMREEILAPDIECEIYSPTKDDCMTTRACMDSKIDLLDCIPKRDVRRARRGLRKRRTISLLSMKQPLLLSSHFGNPPFPWNMPSASKGKKRGPRKNNDHWTTEEVIKLVEGVSKYGVGRWTELKKQKFSSSVRTAVHLKDKWRNLLKACEGRAQNRRLLRLDSWLLALGRWAFGLYAQLSSLQCGYFFVDQ
ncbi:hypothetical protein BRADI_3g27663v3 [Brachypodium distachyon]|uniref:Uncharacterized protein n=1 Tax=Brachypodium distachyon TaxID=15368 RepID=A0A0Q3LX60_BRADI|nr:hypothetical protein BRADI_3g27663v3 [Brachypodium distachyon]